MNKKRTLIVVSIVIATLLISGVSLYINKQLVNTPDRLLSLGEKYLAELNYEQALVQFLKGIEIDPMNPRGYIGAAEAHIGLGRMDDALSILKQGLERTGDGEIRNMIERIEASSDASIEFRQQKTDRVVAVDLQNPDGENYGIGYGNTLDKYIVGGKSIEYRDREYFAISGSLFTRTEKGIECVLAEFYDEKNDVWCRFGSWIGITGNWLYATAGEQGGTIFRYNLLTKEANNICDLEEVLSYTYNPSVLIVNDRIVVIEGDGSSFWSMNLLGGDMHKIASFPSSTVGFLFSINGRLFYSINTGNDDNPSAPEIIGAELYDSRFTWGQIYSISIEGNDVRQESSKKAELEAARSAWPNLIGRNAARPQDVDDNPSPPIGYEFVLPHENAIYSFDGSVIWKVENGITEAVWQHTDHTTYGNLDYIWGYSGYGSGPNVYRQRVARPLWIDYPYMVLAEYDMEWTGDGSGTYSCTEATLIQPYIFNTATGEMQQENPYGSVLSKWAAVPQGYGLIGSEVWYRFFTADAIYELEHDNGEFTESSKWYLYDRLTGERISLGSVSEIENMSPSFAIMP